MTVDTLGYMKRLEAAGVPRAQAEAHAEALRDEIAPQLVTSTDLGAAVDRLEGKIEALDVKIDTVAERLDAKIDTKIDHLETRIEALLWRHTVTILLAVVAVGGLLLRFAR